MILKRVADKVRRLSSSKQEAESDFWKDLIKNLEKWYTGELTSYYKTPNPAETEKIKVSNLKDSSILTWLKLHQQVKYLKDLELTDDTFSGLKLMDIGAGPMPSASVFRNCEVYCLEPLLHKYLEAGFPLHYYDNCRFIHAVSENIPVEDEFFDAIISVNAIDHVDDLRRTSLEVKRVLKRNGLFRMHVHYHKATKLEPVEITDELFLQVFSWCPNLHTVSRKSSSHSTTLEADETFVLWSNF
ncbi:MAG: class I SAM-dependent methyltransferase [Nitrospirae bacterium]|nr:class I SAM-dependent methyltransferase [Nitrospirota bacterium]